MRALSASLLLVALGLGLTSATFPRTPARETPDLPDRATRLNRLAALEIELDLVTRSPEAYYLVIDLAQARVDLKSGARLLRSAPVLGVSQQPGAPAGTRRCTYVGLVPPVTPDPGAQGLRLGGRRLPLDFSGRLTEGPRHRSRLWFCGGLVLQSVDTVCPDSAACVGLDGPDIKALGSALQPGAAAILVPSAVRPTGADR
jgi:hypothetical protein